QPSNKPRSRATWSAALSKKAGRGSGLIGSWAALSNATTSMSLVVRRRRLIAIRADPPQMTKPHRIGLSKLEPPRQQAEGLINIIMADRIRHKTIYCAPITHNT